MCALLRHHKEALPNQDALAMCTANIDRLEKVVTQLEELRDILEAELR